RLVERRGRLLFDLGDIYREARFLAGDLRVGVIGREGRLEFALVASLGTDQRVFEFLHHATGADDDLHVIATAAFEFGTVNGADEVHGRAIIRSGRARHLVERR